MQQLIYWLQLLEEQYNSYRGAIEGQNHIRFIIVTIALKLPTSTYYFFGMVGLQPWPASRFCVTKIFYISNLRIFCHPPFGKKEADFADKPICKFSSRP